MGKNNKKKKTKGSIWDGWGASQVKHRFGEPQNYHAYQFKVFNPDEIEPLFVMKIAIPLFETWRKCDERAGAIAVDIVAYWQRHTNPDEHPQEAAQRVQEVLGKDALGTLDQLNSEIQDEAEWRVFRPDGSQQSGGFVFKRPLSDAQIRALLRQHPGYSAEIAKERHKMAIN